MESNKFTLRVMTRRSYYMETTEDGNVGIGSIRQDFLGDV